MRKIKFSIVIGWLVCGLGALFYCYEYLLRIEPSVMIPNLMSEFHVTAATLGIISAFYYYAYTPMQVVVGILIDRYGARIMLTVAICSCVVGSFLFGKGGAIYLAGLGRFLIGFGSAFAFVGVLKLAAEWLPKHHFALFAGFATSLGMIGAMVGDVELSFLVNHIGWRHTVFIGTIVGLVLIPLIYFVVRDTPRHVAKVQRKQVFRDTFAGLWEIIKNPQMWLSGIIGCLFFLPLTVIAELWGIPFLHTVYHIDADKAAFVCATLFLGWMFGAPLNGWFSDKIGARRLPLILCGFIGAVVLAIIILKPAFMTITLLHVFLFILGLFASVEIVAFAVSRENNPTRVAATAVAFTNLLIMLGGMFFQPLIGILLDFSWHGSYHHGVRVYTAAQYQHAFWIVPICMLLGVLLSFALRETCKRDIEDEFDSEE